MEKAINYDRDYDVFSTHKVENVITIDLKDTFLLRISDLKTKSQILDFFDLIASNDEIKVLLILGSPQEREASDYFEFYRELSRWISDQDRIHRIYNAIDQVILAIRKMDKIIVHADRRKSISLFLNWSLACDYRIVADNSVFQNRYLEMGLIPKGGSTFFLSKLLGTASTLNVLFSDENMTAKTALGYGIVNEIVPSDELEYLSLKTAKRFARHSVPCLTGIKQLLNYTMKELDDYLNYENEILFRIVNQQEFRNRISTYYKNTSMSL